MRKLREESTNIIHDVRRDVRHDVFEVRKKSDYDCKLDVVWDDFIEGLLAIGARASQENETWVLDFSFPIVLEEPIDLVVQINILSFTKNGRACPLTFDPIILAMKYRTQPKIGFEGAEH
jgi:hypothetical protein